MYCAKANGGDSYRLFENDMRPGTDRLSLEVELRDALERNEVELYYQPRVDTITGRPTAVEACTLAAPTRGLVLPGMFIPIAEETGLIDAIGQWVLERACQDRVRGSIPAASHCVPINLSPLQFAREELPERVAAALADGACRRSRWSWRSPRRLRCARPSWPRATWHDCARSACPWRSTISVPDTRPWRA